MINYETILSSYDDKLTLMQWLKKVEAALKDASATGFHVNKRGNATITFSIDFENGEPLESEPLVLQQGESVESGEIRNGHLFLTLTNGDELDCGALFNGEVPSLNVRSLEVSGGLLLGDDANAAIGGDLVVHGLTEVENIKAYGDVETESLTAAGDEISAKKPVVEVMTGYAFFYGAAIVTPIFASACKNGNKLTLVWFGTITPTADVGHNDLIDLGGFTIPSNVGIKLTPYSQGGISSMLDSKTTSAYIGGVSKVPNESITLKDSNSAVHLYTRPSLSQTMTANTTYILRYEVTFLLSENLAA